MPQTVTATTRVESRNTMPNPTTQRWVSCSRDVNWSVAQERHLVTPGQLTTACGATASTPDTWRGNSTKPKCNACATQEKAPQP